MFGALFHKLLNQNAEPSCGQRQMKDVLFMYAAVTAKEKVQGKEQRRKVRHDVKEKLLQKQYLLVGNTHMWDVALF